MNKASVQIEPENVNFPSTFIKSEAQFVVRIKNIEKKQIHCCWKHYSSVEEEKKAAKQHHLNTNSERSEFIEECAFHSKIFKFNDNEFTIWPHRYKEIIVYFHPNKSIKTSETAYLCVEETGQRFPLILQGTGYPPEASFSVTSINIGHVALDSVLEYEIFFQNTGSVSCDYELVPKDTKKLKFEFSPNKGTLNVGEKIPVRVKFFASQVGSFNERFEFGIVGRETGLPGISLFGKVIGPTFDVSTKYLLFGTVSYGFLYTKTFEIINNSNIDFDFTLETSFNLSRKEFSISPQTGTVQKNSAQTIKVEFIPMNIGQYEIKLFINIAHYEDHIVTIPIIAECLPPSVQILKNEIDLGEIYIGMSYNNHITFIDETEYPAKFEFYPQTEMDDFQACVEFVNPTGVVKANETIDVPFTIVARQLGVINIVRKVKFFGSDDEPLSIYIKALVKGPQIGLSLEKINFGKLGVLERTKKQLTITNDSTIPAPFRASVECRGSVFSITQDEGIIEPHSQLILDVYACLDDIILFKGNLILIFNNLNPIIIPLSATGIGSTITSNISLTTLDFGNIFSETPNKRVFDLTNEGRRSQGLRFVVQRPVFSRQDSSSFYCKITPDDITLEPGETATFEVVVFCSKTLSFSVGIQCTSNIQRQRSDLFNLVVKGAFVAPYITFSEQSVIFKHVHDSLKEEMATGGIRSKNPIVPSSDLLGVITRELIIRNMSKLPITCLCNCPLPFSIINSNFMLQPQESKQLTVTFDPTIKEDFSCETITKNLVVSYEEHPNIKKIPLIGSFVFPNIKFTPSDRIDFGVLTMNTERSQDITMDNPTELPVEFVWELIDGDNVSNIFDVYPIRGKIEPNSSEVARVSFFAQNDSGENCTAFEANAICHVIGGPDYLINLVGESANIQYKIDPYMIDFGFISYTDSVNATVSLQNLSDVQLKFNVRKAKNSCFQNLTITPMSGLLLVGSTQKFSISAKGGLPKNIEEPFFIKIGYFDEVRVNVKACCFMPQVKFSIPHANDCPLLLQYISDRKREKEIRKKSKKPIGSARRNVQEDEEEEESDEIIEPTDFEYAKVEKRLLKVKISQKGVFENSIKKIKKKKMSADEYDGYVSAKYFIDVGKIIFGKLEKFSFTITSKTQSPISFTILDYALEGTGFYFKKKSFVDIQPDNECLIELNFDVKRRITDIIGENDFDIPIKFNDDFAYIVRIHCNLVMPVLSLSQNTFNFGTTIVGQSHIMTLQLQNMNYVPIEFTFKGDYEDVFTISSLNGVLPPSSFTNVEICFLPNVEKTFSAKIPIYVNYNTQPFVITLNGEGVQLSVKFDPPELNLPPILPFSEPSTMEVKMYNPAQYPVEVLATQFDLQLLLEEIEQKRKLEREARKKLRHSSTNLIEKESEDENFDKEVPSQVATPGASNVNKFSICVVVHGTNLSGKTTLCHTLSKELGNVPIISLKDIWKDLNEKGDAEQSEYVNAIYEIIEKPEYAEGFVVDGLEGLNENSETDAFLLRCIKGKNVWDEISKNPWNVFQHTNTTSYEQALAYLLSALNGHYVFFVALKSSEDVIKKREEVTLSIERKRRRHQIQVEKEMLFKMTEEEYLMLTEEERASVDKKRESYRKKNLKQIFENDKEEEKSQDPKRKRSSGSKSKSSHDKKKDHKKSHEKDHKKQSEKERKKQNDKKSGKSEDPKKDLRALKAVPTDPIQKSLCLFYFTLGSLSQMIKEGGEQFAAIDPIEISRNPLFNNVQPDLQKSAHSVVILPFYKNFNSILIEADADKETVAEYATSFVPKINQMKEKAFTKLIPLPRIIMPDPSSFMKATLLTMPKYFSIVVEEQLMPETNSSRQRHAGRQDSNTKSGRKSKAKKERPIEVLSPEELSRRTPRWRIDPLSSEVIKIKFDAQLVGDYKENIIFSIINGKSQIMKLTVRGKVAYPDITRDSKFIFPKRQLRITPKAENCYIVSTQEFYFGSILVEEKNMKNSACNYKSTINIQNPSIFPVELFAFFADNSQKQLWTIENPSLTIQPGETKTLTFGVRPTTSDLFKNVLQLFVKDNPDPYSFPVIADCCAPIIELNSQKLSFEKLLLDQEKEISLELKNVGKIPALWNLKNFNSIGSNFSFSKTSGLINPRSSDSFAVTFSSSKPISVKKSVVLETLDKDGNRIFNSKQIMVTAEAFDVNLDIIYPKGLDHLDYGALRVQQQKVIPITIKNKGKYPLLFKVQTTAKKFNQYFDIQPMEGTIGLSDKSAIINFAFSAAKLVTFSRTKGISIDIIDSITNSKTQTITVFFSAQTVYSKFEINPINDLPFGALPTGSNLIQHITIENKGSFPFEFDIQQKVEPVIEEDESPQKGKKKKKPVQSKSAALRSLNMKSTLLKGRGKKNDKYIIAGNFVIVPSQGIVPPGTKMSVDIDFLSQTPGQYKSTILTNISDANPQEFTEPLPINLTAESFIPGIEVSDFEKIFAGTLLCLRYDIVKKPGIAFLEDDQVLFFSAHIIGEHTEIPVILSNVLPIPCTVDCTLKPNAKGKAALMNFPFDASEKIVQIPPNSSKEVKIVFHPNNAENFSGTFEAVVRGSSAKSLKFGLEGIGTIPTVSVLTQLDKPGKNGMQQYNIGRTLVGFIKEKRIIVANDGLINAKVIVSVRQSPDFELEGVELDTEIVLIPGAQMLLKITYKPEKVRKGQFDIFFNIVDNQKANFGISIFGEGFSEDLIFEGLQDDDLYFRDSVVGRQQQQTFALRNVCHDDIRFQWPQHGDFTFSPSVGHVRSGKSKVITVTFISEKVTKYTNFKALCQWQKIRLNDPNAPDWDNSQISIRFTTKGNLKISNENLLRTTVNDRKVIKKPQIRRPMSVQNSAREKEKEKENNEDDKEIVKIVDVKPEPINTVLPIKTKDLVLKITALSDFIKYSIDTTDISFSPTMMYEKRIVQCKMTNTSQIKFEYQWRINDFRALRTDYASTRPPVFRIAPESGFIEAGCSTIFHISFEPEEVDDFTAILKCDIPFLVHMPPPVINVSGFSKRPLCHFNVVLSDYISAGRRHPDYTAPLPEDIRVIEMFSSGIGKEAKKKFEVINPTSSSYEIIWKPVFEGKSSITCETPAALVSSGKRYSVAFSYLPTSVKTVESQWIFQIPEYQVSVLFLIVGRIVPQ